MSQIIYFNLFCWKYLMYLVMQSGPKYCPYPDYFQYFFNIYRNYPLVSVTYRSNATAIVCLRLS